MNTKTTEAAPPADSEPDSDAEPDGSGVVVEVSDTQSHLKVDRAAIARLVRRTLLAEGVAQAEVSIALVDDAAIHAVNRRALAHDWPTDVITFRLSEPGDEALAAELVVSAEMAAATAREAGVDPWDELALYLVHGLLHLCGHDDADDAGRAAMRRREGEILALQGLSNTFSAALDGPAPGRAVAGGRESSR